MADQVILLVGTRKGAFVLSSTSDRRRWRIRGPVFAETPVYHLTADTRPSGTPLLYAAVNAVVWGADVAMSQDLGRTWASLGRPKYAADTGLSVERVWHLEPGLPSQPGVLYAGVEPAGLFMSADGGRSWESVDALNRHPTRSRWQPGAGGLCLHTILLHPTDPQTMWVGISGAGVFRTVDGGRSWVPANRGPGLISCRRSTRSWCSASAR